MFDRDRKDRFLEVLSATGRRADAARAAGVTQATIYNHQRSDPIFAAALTDALETYRGVIEQEIHRRAIEGVEEPVYQQGKKVGTITRYSDQLLLAHARRHIPEYRDRIAVDSKVDAVVAGNTEADLSKLTPENRRKLREVLATLLPSAAPDPTDALQSHSQSTDIESL